MSQINWIDERDTLYAALMFYTRVPVPGSYRHKESHVSKAAKYLPLIGCLVGTFSAVVFLATELFFSTPAAILASIIASVMVTGALHEDGFADVCDGFGAGTERERILQIMADSCLGSYGTIGLILLLGLKFSLMNAIAQLGSPLLAMSILAAHTLSRWFALCQMQRQCYARVAGQGKSASAVAGRLTRAEWLLVLLFPAASLSLLPREAIPLALLFAALITLLWTRHCQVRIGGYTGDCLGATQQMSEIGIYLGVAATCNFI